MYGLPRLPAADGIKKHISTVFKGYDHRLGAGDGTLWDMENLTGDYYPLLGSRKPRYSVEEIAKPNGFYCHDGKWWVNGNKLYKDGTLKATLTAYETDVYRTMVSLGAYIVILPDKMYYNTATSASGTLGATTTQTGATIKNGTYAGESAVGNTIYKSGVDWASLGYHVGDAVTITDVNDGAYSITDPVIIREISGGELHFYENTFWDDPDHADVTGLDLTITRSVPDMDFICENENRLWGCKGDHIYACKLGDPFNWNVLDGLSTDSYQVDVGSVGDFTACCSYLGYPVFFKEEHIYKVYGDRPSNFQVMGSATLGVEEGSSRSPAIAGETMFYLARTGVVAYAGGIPQSIHGVFGTERYRNAVGGSDGVRYYISMQDTRNNWHLFVFDSTTGLWHREDNKHVLDFGWNGELYFLDSTGTIWLNGNARTVDAGAVIEAPLTSMAEFGDFTESKSSGWSSSTPQPNKKGTAKIQIRIELEANATVIIDMQFDSDGVWRNVSTLETTVKRSYYLPIIPRRSDHFRIRFRGTGQWRLYSLVRENYIGSEL